MWAVGRRGLLRVRLFGGTRRRHRQSRLQRGAAHPRRSRDPPRSPSPPAAPPPPPPAICPPALIPSHAPAQVRAPARAGQQRPHLLASSSIHRCERAVCCAVGLLRRVVVALALIQAEKRCGKRRRRMRLQREAPRRPWRPREKKEHRRKGERPRHFIPKGLFRGGGVALGSSPQDTSTSQARALGQGWSLSRGAGRPLRETTPNAHTAHT